MWSETGVGACCSFGYLEIAKISSGAMFSLPSNIIKLFGFETLLRKIPFYFGTHPFSLIPDLKDRLMSPVNYRFSKLEMERILESKNFSFIEVVKTSSDLYIFSKK